MSTKKNIVRPVNTLPLDPSEQYWREIVKINKDGSRRVRYEFSYENALTFLQNRGFAQLRLPDGSCQFIRIAPPEFQVVAPSEIRKFFLEFTKGLELKEVVAMVYCGYVQYLRNSILSYLPFVDIQSLKTQRDEQDQEKGGRNV